MIYMRGVHFTHKSFLGNRVVDVKQKLLKDAVFYVSVS